jgi:hypothetical protein
MQNKPKTIIISGLIGAIVFVSVAYFLHQQSSRQVAVTDPAADRSAGADQSAAAPQALTDIAPGQSGAPSANPALIANPAPAAVIAQPGAVIPNASAPQTARPLPAMPKARPKPAAPAANAGAAADPNIVRPEARDALAMVGADPDAQAVWENAINDPTVPPNERKDLIEDLNQDGFPDPDHVTSDDLPLIVARLNLIESIGPNAIDDVNDAAFHEAYKDLQNMAAQASKN